MSDYRSQPPWEFLCSASTFSLRSYELSRLNHAANLRKEIEHLLDQWLEENACALLARWLVENDDRPAGADERARLQEQPEVRVPTASHNILRESVRAAFLRRSQA
jgi:hypothetical protein